MTLENVGTDAVLRITRITTIIVGIAMLAYGALALPAIIAQWSYLNPVYSIGCMVVLFGIPIGLAIAAPRLSLGAIRFGLIAFGGSFVLALALWVPALVHHMPTELQPWIQSFTAIPTSAIALAVPPPPAWIYTLAISASDAALRGFPRGFLMSPVPMQDALFGLMFSGIFTALIITVRARAVDLDRATALTRAKATTAAAAAAESQESQRIDLLIHDDVMSTLLLASRGDPHLAESVRESAVMAIRRLQSRTLHEEDHDDVDTETFIARLRALVASVSTDVLFSIGEAAPLAIPADVARGFATAVGESVRNSIAHAGGSRSFVNRSVLVTVGADRIDVAVVDDGVGFDVERGRRQSIGVAANILGRMRGIPGGYSRIRSGRGMGTRVELSWVVQ
jgi:signal transduction histidine kinase